MPKIQFRSNAKPSVYAYPELLQPPKKEEKEKVSTAILSITAKKSKQKKDAKDDAMEVVRFLKFLFFVVSFFVCFHMIFYEHFNNS